jgi:2-dehydro-3-deoxyphosphogluconate aldolase/(4S)-4-hydroxy-2-oxoglutarate aldolase
MTDLAALYADCPVIAIFADPDPARCVRTARALARGGLVHAEVLLRTPTAWESVAALLAEEAVESVAVGTIATVDDVRRAADMGAQVGISAWLDADLVRAAQACGLPYVPTVESSTEVARARAMGLSTLKLFPAECSGGTERLRLFAGVYPEVSFVCTGGVGPDNLDRYLALPTVAAVGGNWFAPADAVADGDEARLRSEAEKTVQAIKNTRSDIT